MYSCVFLLNLLTDHGLLTSVILSYLAYGTGQLTKCVSNVEEIIYSGSNSPDWLLEGPYKICKRLISQDSRGNWLFLPASRGNWPLNWKLYILDILLTRWLSWPIRYAGCLMKTSVILCLISNLASSCNAHLCNCKNLKSRFAVLAVFGNYYSMCKANSCCCTWMPVSSVPLSWNYTGPTPTRTPTLGMHL